MVVKDWNSGTRALWSYPEWSLTSIYPYLSISLHTHTHVCLCMCVMVLVYMYVFVCVYVWVGEYSVCVHAQTLARRSLGGIRRFCHRRKESKYPHLLFSSTILPPKNELRQPQQIQNKNKSWIRKIDHKYANKKASEYTSHHVQTKHHVCTSIEQGDLLKRKQEACAKP